VKGMECKRSGSQQKLSGWELAESSTCVHCMTPNPHATLVAIFTGEPGLAGYFHLFVLVS